MSRVNLGKNIFGRFLKVSVVFVLMTGWIFSGWPQIWPLGELGTGKIQIPPEIQEAMAGTETFTTTGDWSPDSGVTSVNIECWGGGGGGGKGATRNAGGGGGGGGGGYIKKLSIPVAYPNSYTVTIGTGGASAAAGVNSSFTGDSSITITANGGGAGSNDGGSGGTGGSGSCTDGCSTGPYTGGNGAAGTAGAGGAGGGGGGSGGTGENGNTATSQTGATEVTGGGNGGNGGAENIVGSSPSIPCSGGGGGGGNRSGGLKAGGVGLAGKCILTWADGPITSFIIGGTEATTTDTSLTTITFPEIAPSATSSVPWNNLDTVHDPQVLSADSSAPVAKIKNTGASTYNITLEITTWTNSLVNMEYYNLVTDGLTNIETVTSELSNAAGAARSVATGVSIDAGTYKDLYLKLVLSSVAGKTASSTITVLGQAP